MGKPVSVGTKTRKEDDTGRTAHRSGCLIVMLGKTHLAAGVCAGAALVLTRNLGIRDTVIALAGAGLGSLLPDIDSRSSTISQAVKPVGMVVSAIAGHRKLFHDPFLYLLLFGLLWKFQNGIALFLAPVFLGIGSHLLLDALNPHGIPFLYFTGAVRIRLLKIRTGSSLDKIIGRICSVATVLLIVRWAMVHFF